MPELRAALVRLALAAREGCIARTRGSGETSVPCGAWVPCHVEWNASALTEWPRRCRQLVTCFQNLITVRNPNRPRFLHDVQYYHSTSVLEYSSTLDRTLLDAGICYFFDCQSLQQVRTIVFMRRLLRLDAAGPQNLIAKVCRFRSLGLF